MYTDDFKNIVLEDFYLNDKISNTENYHNIKKWLRYQLFPCKDADSVLRNKTILTKLNWPIDNNKIYIDCIFSMKTYFNMFLRMYNPKSSQSYAWLLTYFDEIFSYKHIQEFCKKKSILITEFYSCMNELNRFAKNTHTLGNYMSCPDNKYNNLKGLLGYTMFNDRIELILNGLKLNDKEILEFIEIPRSVNWTTWFNDYIINLNLQSLFENDSFESLSASNIKSELLEFPLHKTKTQNSYKFHPNEVVSYTKYLEFVNMWIESRTITLNNLIQ